MQSGGSGATSVGRVGGIPTQNMGGSCGTPRINPDMCLELTAAAALNALQKCCPEEGLP